MLLYSLSLEDANDSSSSKDSGMELEAEHEAGGGDLPAIVVYIVEPFTYFAEWEDMRRLAMLGLMRCFTSMLAGLPEALRANIHLQVHTADNLHTQ